MGLISWLPLTNNAEIKDMCGNNISTLGSQPVYGNTTCILGSGYTFSGSNIKVEGVKITPTMSFSVWVRMTTSGSYHIIDFRDSSGAGIQPIYYNNTSGIQFYSSGGGSEYIPCTLTVNKWHHLVVTVLNGKVTLWQDGTKKGTASATFTIPTMTSFLSVGSRCSNANNFVGNIQDLKVYNHALSTKEIKELSKAKMVDYSFDLKYNLGIFKDTGSLVRMIYDGSGYGNDASLNGIVKRGLGSDIGYSSLRFDGTKSYIEMPTVKKNLTASNFTIEFSINPEESGTRDVIFGDYSLSGSSGFNIERNSGSYSDNRIRVYMDNGSVDVSTTKCKLESGVWTHVAIAYDKSGKTLNIYKNGSLAETFTNIDSVKTKTTDFAPWRIGSDSRDTNVRFNGRMSYFRIYATTLSANDISESYKTRIQIARNGSLFTNRLHEDGIDKSVVFDYKMNTNANSVSEAYIKYDNELYYEDDGSMWVRLFHHNNPASAQFSSSDTFTTGVWKDKNRWFNMGFCNNVNKWELMVKQTLDSAAIPNTGTVSTVYFNTSLNDEEVNRILERLPYIQTEFVVIPIYPILFSSDGTPVIFVGKHDEGVYEITIATDIANKVYEYAYITDGGFLKSSYAVGKAVISSYSGISVGANNELLSDLVSATPFNSEYKYRWIQSKNPMTAVYGDVDATDVTYITSSTVKGRVPKHLQEVEYIQSSGSQYIDTDYAFKTDNTRIEADIMIVTNSSSQSLWGSEEYIASSGNDRNFSAIFHGSNGSYGLYLGAGNVGTISVGLNERHTIKIETHENKVYTVSKDGKQVASGTYTRSMNTADAAYISGTKTAGIGNFYIFSNHNSSRATSYGAIQNVGAMRVYGFKMYDDGIKVRDFIPCYRKEDNMVGLYDTVTKMFFIDDSASSNFAKGANKVVTYNSPAASYGGMYAMKGTSTYIAANNGNSGNWWGAIGAYSLHQNGIPAWSGQIVKSGYLDVYLRVDNVNLDLSSITDTNFKSYSNGEVYSPNIYEY